MPQTPVQAAPVLEYDPLTRSYTARRLWWRIAFLVVCGVIGAYGGFQLSRGQFRAWAYVSVPLPTTVAAAQNQQQAAAVTAMLSPTSLAAGVASARINLVSLTPAEISHRLKVRAMPDRRLVEVSAVYDDAPEVAAAIVAGVVNNYVASNPSARMVGGPAILAREQLQPMVIFAGAVAGLAAGWVVVTLRKR